MPLDSFTVLGPRHANVRSRRGEGLEQTAVHSGRRGEGSLKRRDATLFEAARQMVGIKQVPLDLTNVHHVSPDFDLPNAAR